MDARLSALERRVEGLCARLDRHPPEEAHRRLHLVVQIIQGLSGTLRTLRTRTKSPGPG